MGGISSAQAAQMLQGLSGSLDLTISAIPASSGSSPGYSINAIPTSGSTQLINVPIPTVNGKSTGGIDFQTGKYISTATIPVIYSYEDNGVATPTGFQGANGQLSNTYTETINGQSYTFIIDNGKIEYAPTGSQAFAQLEFNANPNPSIPSTGGTTLSQPQDVNAFSSDSIATGNIPTALPTPGTAGLLNLQPASQQFADLYNQNPTLTNNMISNPQSTSTTNNTNTFLSGASQFLSSYPSYLASTAANLAKYLGSIPGYTPGGVPSKINGPGEI